ncbi:MAG: lactate racemase domain-containing protein [Anaerolineae bacterium]|nr:lactate racemase domain-containing protein [Anaerolineae bacterium]
MLIAQATATDGQLLSEDTIRETIETGLRGRFTGARVLALIPDHTRTIPLPQLFPILVDALSDVTKLDFMVALGTHPGLSEESRCKLVGITLEERQTTYRHVGILNHEWDNPTALTEIGTISEDEMREMAGPAWHPSLSGDIAVQINRAILDYDHILIVGPSFPHEVVGISGGAKYMFPGIGGPDMINKFHWLGALITTMKIIGIKDTPVRDVIHTAATFVPTPITLLSLVVVGSGLAGMFIGDHIEAWGAAADLSRRHHIKWIEKPFQQVLSWCPPMYDELWTGGKAMYKLEPAVADGGELIIYAPHIDTVSVAHGQHIYALGYHVLPYFLNQWDKYKHHPTSAMAHSTHVKGIGTFEDGIERPRIQVTLASKISPEDCQTLNLGYRDPADIHPQEWADREDEGVLFVPKAGETLYRVRA